MEQKQSEYRDRQRGSATVEAVVGFTAFLLAIFTILGLANFCRAQMLVSAAMDTAAKEMAQYSYFYEISGLKKFEGSLDLNGQTGTDNINQIIGTVDTLYSSVNGAVDQTITEMNNTQDMINAGNFDTTAIKNSLDNVGGEIENVKIGIEGVANAFKDVGNDPLLYMRSIVALLASEGYELAKRAVAVPLTRAFVSKHFGDSTQEANAKLEELGIEGGLDAMNFNLSKIFSDDKHQDIELVVHYKVKLMKVFDWVVLEAKLSKVAHCRAWLGGDHVLDEYKIKPAPAGSGGGETGTGDGSGGTETPSGEEKPDDGTEKPDDGTDKPNQGSTEETTKPTETTAPPETKPPVDIEGSYWYLPENDQGYNERKAKFAEEFRKNYQLDGENPDNFFVGRDKDGHVYGYEYCISAEDAEHVSKQVFVNTYYKISQQEKKYQETNGEKGYEPGTTTGYTCVIYIPENISEEDYNELRAKTIENSRFYREFAKQQYGVDVPLMVTFEKAGGNYDYGEGAQ